MDKQSILDAYPCLKDIPDADKWISLHEIHDGDSHEQKFRVKDQKNQRFFIRLSEKRHYDRKKNEFTYMKLIYENQIPIPEPVRFGLCNAGESIYLMFQWIYGESGSERLLRNSRFMQYIQGAEAGKYLRQIHLCIDPDRPRGESAVIGKKIGRLQDLCGPLSAKMSCLPKMLDFLHANLDLVANRPQVFLHGDFHVDNLVISYEDSLHLIDFEKWRFGDPVSEIGSALMRLREVSPTFLIGMIDSYFAFKIHVNDLRLLAFYAVLDTLEQIVRSLDQDPQSQKIAMERAKLLLKDYSNFATIKPAWYNWLPEIKPKQKNAKPAGNPIEA